LFVCFTELFAKLLGVFQKNVVRVVASSIHLIHNSHKLVGISLGLIAAPHPRFPVQSHILSAGGDALTT
jgi:hypothetical protein